MADDLWNGKNPFLAEETPAADTQAPNGDLWQGKNPFLEAPKEEGNPLTNLGRGLVKGTVYGIPEQLAKAAQFVGVGGETAKAVAKWGEEGLGGKNRQPGIFEQAGEMIPESVGPSVALMGVGKALSLVPHPAAKVAGGAMYVAGKYITPWLFGAAQAQETRETAAEKGVPEGITPLVTGGVEVAGETLGNIAFGRILGPLGKIGAQLAAKTTAKQALKGTIGDFLKELAFVTMPTEIGTEMGQNYLEALAEKRAGIRPEADPWAEAVSAIGPTAIMTLLLGGAARGAHSFIAGKQADILGNPVDLQAENAQDLVTRRLDAAGGVLDIIPKENEELRKQWADYAKQKIERNLPIDINVPLDTLSLQIDTLMDEDPEGRRAVTPDEGAIGLVGAEPIEGTGTGIPEPPVGGFGVGPATPPQTPPVAPPAAAGPAVETPPPAAPATPEAPPPVAGAREPSPLARRVFDNFMRDFDKDPGSGDPRLDDILRDHIRRGDITDVSDVQGILDDYANGEYGEAPPAAPQEPAAPPVGGVGVPPTPETPPPAGPGIGVAPPEPVQPPVETPTPPATPGGIAPPAPGSVGETEPNPTEGQKEAGNYAKEHRKLYGLEISIENKAGSVRKGVDENGTPWETPIAHDYGYIRKTEGKDGDHVDVFVGPNPESQKAYIVDQKNPKTGKFDEHKTLLGFNSLEEARAGYLANYDKSGPTRIMGITEMSVDEFKEWLKGDTTKRVSKEEAPRKEVSPVPPPVNGKRNWYEFSDPDFPSSQLTDEEQERLLDGGPTPEETKAWEDWKRDRLAAASKTSGQQQANEAKAKDISERVTRKWAQAYPHLSVRQVAQILEEMAGGTERRMKASEFMSVLTSRMNTPNKYDFLAKVLDRLDIPIVITLGPSSDPSGRSITDGAYARRINPDGSITDPGRIIIAPKAMAQSRDFGPGYGVAHILETFVHEGLHGVTAQSKNWPATQARLEAFRDTLLQYQTTAPPKTKVYLQHSDKYEISELVSEALSDSEFAQWLDSIPAEGVRNPSKTLWGQLKDIIFRLLETFGIPKSKLDELNEILDDGLAVPMPEEEAKPPEPTPPPAPSKAPEPKPPEPPTPPPAPPQTPLENVIHPLYGQLKKPNTVELGKMFSGRISNTDMKFDKDTIKGIIAQEYNTTTAALSALDRRGLYNHKAVEEAFEYGLILSAREEIEKRDGKDPATLRALTNLYERQANLSARTSESTIMQQYSTPMPIAWLMNKYLDMIGTKSFVSVYEPTAGNGMLLMGANRNLTGVYANELDKGARLSNLRDFLKKGKVTNQDALSLLAQPAQKVDRVIMNPPFGTAKSQRAFDGYAMTKLEHQIVASAMAAMKDNGKAAFIIGGHNIKSTGQMTMPDRIFFNWLYNNFNVTHNIDVNGDLYARQGTKFPIRVITVEGRRAEPLTGLPEYTNIEPAETIDQLAEILGRGKTYGAVQGEAEGPAAENGRPGGGEGNRVPPGVPPEAGVRVGGPEEGGGNLPGGELGGGAEGPAVGPGTGYGPGNAAGPAAGGEGVLPGGDTGRNPVVGGERGPAEGVAPGREGGEEAGGTGVKGPQSSLDDAMDELESMFMPYEAAPAAEGMDEAKYEKAKPALTKIATEIVQQEPEITHQGFLKAIRDRLAAKWDAAKAYVLRFAREEFPAIVQIVKDSSFFQVDYKPKSQGPNGHTRVPRNQEQSIQRALDAIVEEHGDIDDWVMNELGYKDRNALYKAFAAEQIDALALTIENITANSGMILGDQTGVGKGRVVAGTIRWANRKGLIPVFVTEKPNLFSDMYRDLMAIDHPIRPFIMNSAKANILNQETGEVIMNMGKDGKGSEAYRDGRMNWDTVTGDPMGYFKRNKMQVVFTTYSQHMAREFKNQDSILTAMGPNNIFILDESHNAAGSAAGDNSNTKLKFTAFLDHVDGVLYSSATFAKTPENMGIYYRTALGDVGMRMWELAQAIKAGGNPLQEYISNALARAGQYLRRELDFAGVDFLSTETMTNLDKTDPEYAQKYARLQQQYERDKEVSDKSNMIVRQNVDFSRAIKADRQGLETLLREKYGVMLGGTGGNRTSADTTNFSSVVHNFNSQLLMGIKVQRTIDEAKKALADGRKVVINLTNTMGSFVEDLIDKGEARVGDPIDFTFKSVLKRSIDNCMKIRIKSPGGQVSTIRFTTEDMRYYMPGSFAAWQRVMRSWEKYDVSDLHSSPIDFLRHELEKISGKPVTELTNRKYMIDYADKSGTPTLANRDAAAMDRQRQIRLFNTGLSDVIIINRAGSVGISLHSSETFKNVDKSPQKPRRMLLLQPDPDINVFMQALGRIFRKGQTTLPDYRYITSDLPTEIRPNVVLTRKMKSLKANTTSKQTGSEARTDIPDMMNHHGDDVVRAYLDRNHELADALDLDPGRPESITYVKASGRASILPVELQKDFFADIETDYHSLIQELTERGENDLITRNYDYKARSIFKNLLYAGPDASNPFTGSVYSEQMVVRQLKRPHTAAKLREMIDKNLGGKDSAQFSKDLLEKVKAAATAYVDEWTRKQEERYPGDPSAQQRALDEKKHQMNEEFRIYRSLLDPASERYQGNAARQMRIGFAYEIPRGANSQENLDGVLTNIVWTAGQGNPFQLSKLKFVFSLADPIQTIVNNASQGWFRDETSRTGNGIPSDWDTRIGEERQEEKVIITGNMVKAFNILLGLAPKIGFEMVNFTREDKSTEFGLVIARKDEERVKGITEGALGREVVAEQACEYLVDERVETERIVTSRNGEVNIQSVITPGQKIDGIQQPPTRAYVVSVPASREKGAKYYQDKDLMALVLNGNFRKHSQRMLANVDADHIWRFMETLGQKFNMNFVLPLDQQSQPMPYQEAELGITGEETPEERDRKYREMASKVDVIYNGYQESGIPGRPGIPLFTDKATGSTFSKQPGEPLADALARVRTDFKPMPFVEALTDRFQKTPQDDAARKLIVPFMDSQHDFQMKDKYFGLPWWNAKKYPAWRRAFEIFGIDRPESRGRHMHSFAKIAEPFLKLDANMRAAGKSGKDIQDARDRIARVIITGDAQLGPQLKALRRQVRTMREGPEKDHILERIKQIETENRYSDEQLLAGIRDDQGKKVALSREEIEVYKSVRRSLDFMFDTYVDHLSTQAFRMYRRQKWYAILAQAAGMDLNKSTTLEILGSGLNRAAILRAVKIQPNIRAIFERVENEITATPELEKMEAGELYGRLAEKMSEQIKQFRDALGELTGETDPKKLTDMARAVFSAYLFTRPQLKKIKALRNTYKKQVAFFPRVREQGKYKMTLYRQIRNHEGLPIRDHQVFMKMFTTEAEGREAYKEALQRYGKDGVLPEDMRFEFNQSTRTPEFAFQGVSDINMQKVLDDAIEGMKIRDTFVNAKGETVDIHERLRSMGYEALAKQFQSRGFGQHMTHRQWNVIKGYEENDLQRVLFNYMTGMAGIMTKQVAASDFLEHMKEVKDPQMFAALSKYGRDQLRNETEMDRLSNKARSFMFTWYLGGVLRPAIIQLTQNFVTGIPKHAQWLRENKIGGAGQADKDYMTAMKDVATKNMTPLEMQMQEKLLTEGVTVDQYIREIFGGLGERWRQDVMKVLHWLAIPFSYMEMFNRKSAALTRFRPAYKKALEEGLNEEDAFQKAFESARDFIYDTHYFMGKANLPQIAQGEGIGTAVKTLYTFKSFTHNFVLSTYNDLAIGDWKTVMHSMAYLALFGGLMGLPFFKDLFEWIEKEFGYSFTKSIRKTLNAAGGNTLETFGMNGLPAMLGANMSGSLAIGIPFVGEDNLATLGGVYEGQYQKMKRGFEAGLRGDYARGAEGFAPEFLRAPIAAARESGEGFATTPRGRPLYNEQGKPISMGPGEAALKAVGFNPTANAREKEMNQTIQRQESWAAELKSDAGERYRIARLHKDPDALKNLMKDVKEINDAIRARDLTKLVPLTSVSKIVQASKQAKTAQQRREKAYKAAEL